MTYNEKVARNSQRMRSRLGNSGRVAGTGIETDRYDETSTAHSKNNFPEYLSRRSGCTLPFELGEDPYYNEDWEKVKAIVKERKRKAREARAS